MSRRNKQPRPLKDVEKDKLEEFIDAIHYSARYGPSYPTSTHTTRLCMPLLRVFVHLQIYRYSDDEFEYRHVQLPKQMLKVIPKEYFDGSRGTLKLLWEEEWRGLGITQVQ